MTIGSTTPATDDGTTYDRAKEVKEFDDSKVGVKGLLDSGITSIPRIFIHPPETRPSAPNPTSNPSSHQIPVVDLSLPRSSVVNQIHQASRTLGFFQIINHGIPPVVLNSMIDSIKGFNEQPTEIKSKYYHREIGSGVNFSTNFDLFTSKAASWRDTLQVKLGPAPLNPEFVPEICRSEVIAWDQHILRLGESLLEILSQALGLVENRLKDLSFGENRVMVGHYYPYCPQPDQTVGIAQHMDPSVLTVVLQNEVGGLQVKRGEDWVNVEPIDGALVVNIGDILEIVSNGEYKSVQHRVLANADKRPRVSIGVFFNPGNREELYGPLAELVSDEKPAVYKQFTLVEFMEKLFKRGLDGKTLVDHFRL